MNTQLYWHTTAPSYTPLQTIPDNRVYVSPDRVDAFVRSFLAFSMEESSPMMRKHQASKSDDLRKPTGESGSNRSSGSRLRSLLTVTFHIPTAGR